MSLVTLRDDQGSRGTYLITIKSTDGDDVLVSRQRETAQGRPQVTSYPRSSFDCTANEFIQQLQAGYLAQGMVLVESQNIVPRQIVSITVVPASPRWELVEKLLSSENVRLATPLTPDFVQNEQQLPGTEFKVTRYGSGGFTLAYQAIVDLQDPVALHQVTRHAVIGALLASGASMAIGDRSEYIQSWLSKRSSALDDTLCDFLADAGLINRPIRIEPSHSAYTAAF